MSRRTRYAAVVVAALAVAVPAASALASPKDSAALSAATFLADNPKIPATCLYPPQSRPTVTLSYSRSGNSAKKKNIIDFKATVTYNGCAIKDWKVGLYSRTSLSAQPALLKSKDTNKKGEAKFTGIPITADTYFQAVTVKVGSLDPATSQPELLVTFSQ